jgi:hypothetical protein
MTANAASGSTRFATAKRLPGAVSGQLRFDVDDRVRRYPLRWGFLPDN